MKYYSKLFLILIITSSLTPLSVKASDIYGIKKGDWMEYEEWWENPAPNYSVWFRTDVTSVTDNSVSHKEEVRMLDGTSEKYQSKSEPPYYQNGNWMYGFPLNLNKGDSFTRGTVEFIVIDELEKTYAEHERIVLFTEGSYENEGNITSFSYYFDKETGVLLEYEVEQSDGYKDGYFLVKTNVWDENSGLIPGYSLFTIVLGILVYYLRSQQSDWSLRHA